MENMRGRRASGQAQPSRQLVYEDFQPSFDWTHDTNAHVLLIDLSGFKKEDVKLQVDNFGKITVSGERRVSESKCSRFKQIFNVPKDSDIETISGKFDHGLLFVIMPKKEIERKAEPQKEIQNDSTKTEGKPANKEESKKEDSDDDNLGPKDEESRENAQNDSTKKEGNVTNKDREPKEDIQDDRSKKEGKPTDKDDEPKEEIQNDRSKKEGKPTNKDGEPKEEIQHDSTQKEGKPANKEESKKEDSDDDNHGPKDGVDNEKGEGKRDDGKEGLKGESGKRCKRKGNLSQERETIMEMKDDLFNKVMETINNNKALIATAMVAFSFGLYVSNKLRKTGE